VNVISGFASGTSFGARLTLASNVNLASTTVTSGTIPLGIVVSAGAGTAHMSGTPNAVTQAVGLGAPAKIKLGSVGGATLIALTPVAGAAGVNAFTVLNIPVTVTGFAWTAGQVVIAGLTNSPVVGGSGTRSFTGSSQTAGGVLTTLTLVSPSKITVGGAATSTTASFSTLTLHFLPEPGTLLLLGAGLAGLGLLGRRRS